jgi:carboxypeptidase Taq
MSDSPLQQLKVRLYDINNLDVTNSLLAWDDRVCMPRGGVKARAEQRTTLSKLSHAMLTSEETARLLEAAEQEHGSAADDSDEAALLRVARRNFDKATKLPESLVLDIARTRSLAYADWTRAKADDNYAIQAPWLEKLLDLGREVAEAYGYEGEMYDAQLDQFEQGLTCAQIDPVFEELKAETIPLIRAVTERQHLVNYDFLHLDYDITKQKEFAESVLTDCGFDWTRGRQDVSLHPFCTSFSRNDVRITTRYSENKFNSALFGSLHEMGHALHGQGTPPEYEGTPLRGNASMSVSESQSRTWENLVGRSREFWQHYYPKLQAVFPDQLGNVSQEQFYRAINRSTPTLIRVEADEMTYNLHIILRYEMEKELLAGTLSVADAPESWNERMRSYLGIVPTTNREGILQDVHWSSWSFGYFPTYTLGNILSVQMWEKALQDIPQIPVEMAQGQFGSLLDWQRQNIHRHGKKYLPQDLVQRATGSPLTAKPYIKYLKKKFGEIYEV